MSRARSRGIRPAMMLEESRVQPSIGRGFGRGTAPPGQRPTHQGIPGPIGIGRGMAGRGKFLEEFKEKKPFASSQNDEGQRTLERELMILENTGKGSLIQSTLDFFTRENDIDLYMDTVWDWAQSSSVAIDYFTKNIKLLTLLKSHGQKIKTELFSRLQKNFEEVNFLMSEKDSMNKEQKEKVVRFCEFMGQLYYRLRPNLLKPERYTVLSRPMHHCIKYLIDEHGENELRVLVKVILVNCGALKAEWEELSRDAHLALLDGAGSEEQRLWLMCVIVISTAQDHRVPPHLELLYSEKLGQELWEEVAVKPLLQVLADIPHNISENDMDKFNVSLDEYNKHKFDDYDTHKFDDT